MNQRELSTIIGYGFRGIEVYTPTFLIPGDKNHGKFAGRLIAKCSCHLNDWKCDYKDTLDEVYDALITLAEKFHRERGECPNHLFDDEEKPTRKLYATKVAKAKPTTAQIIESLSLEQLMELASKVGKK